MSMFKFYEVGGKVRDELMGVKSKDIDYVAVPDQSLLYTRLDAGAIFNLLVKHLDEKGYERFLTTPECFTVRAKFPEGSYHEGTVADFVMARKEVGYHPGTRIPLIMPGTLYDDLERRDFTVNAIAKDEDGNYIDPFKGQYDIKAKVLRTPLPCEQTFNDDPLRILRAIRFKITKGFVIPSEMRDVIVNYDYKNRMPVVSEERIREELFKCFKHDSLITMATLCDITKLSLYIFDNTKLWLKPTNEQ
jgi:tRNA nucleotidyltransferase/poly(A) polymerase